jgi:hypothetical protein
MTDLDRQGRYCPSQSAPTPGGVSAGKIGKCVTALRRRFRPVRCFTSLPGFTRDASAHVSAAVRRHHAPGAAGMWSPFVGCAFALAASAGFRSPLASMPMRELYPSIRIPASRRTK